MIAAHRARVGLVAAVVLAGANGGCVCGGGEAGRDDVADAMPPWDVAPRSQPARQGMQWIPPGELIAGTPIGQLPRIADEELPGAKVAMGGFFIDRHNYPGEPGAIAETGMTRSEAERLCHEQEKRLCTELEWERACKGPQNLTYEYGDRYDPSICATGASDALAPNGVNARCVSAFGVQDMHGGPWNWTASDWGRGSKKKRVTVRGGNGRDGELVGRCANGRAVHPGKGDGRIGVRCCAGEINTAAVDLSVARGSVLSYRRHDPAIAGALAAFAPAELQRRVANLPKALQFTVERLWVWRPIGNEEVMVGGGCARPPGNDACGVVIARWHKDAEPELLAFVSSDWWIPTVGEHDEDRRLFLYGGDIGGAYRKAIIYEWGRIAEGRKFRKKGGGWVAPR